MKQLFRSEPIAAGSETLPPRFGRRGTHWVPVDAHAPADGFHEKDLQMQAFSEAADGIRTHDLLHGKQSVQPRSRTQSRWKQEVFELVGATRVPRLSPGNHGGLGTEWAPELAG
jgi:hypothetical protein